MQHLPPSPVTQPGPRAAHGSLGGFEVFGVLCCPVAPFEEVLLVGSPLVLLDAPRPEVDPPAGIPL